MTSLGQSLFQQMDLAEHLQRPTASKRRNTRKARSQTSEHQTKTPTVCISVSPTNTRLHQIQAQGPQDPTTARPWQQEGREPRCTHHNEHQTTCGTQSFYVCPYHCSSTGDEVTCHGGGRSNVSSRCRLPPTEHDSNCQ